MRLDGMGMEERRGCPQGLRGSSPSHLSLTLTAPPMARPATWTAPAGRSRGRPPRPGSETASCPGRRACLRRKGKARGLREGGEVGARGARARARRFHLSLPHKKTLTGVRLQLSRHHAVAHVHMVQEGVEAEAWVDRCGDEGRERGSGANAGCAGRREGTRRFECASFASLHFVAGGFRRGAPRRALGCQQIGRVVGRV